MTLDVRRFAFQQGPGKRYLGEQGLVDDDAATTSLLPPPAARTDTGRLLPTGTHDLLAGTTYPDRCPPVADPEQRLGHLLLTAFGLQRREPSNQYNDHRTVPSGRARFPVHAFVSRPGRLRYLDVYRHALVDTPAAGPTDGPVSVLLAARYTDLPDPYGRLRCAIGEVELGVYLRALAVAADLFGVAATVRLDSASVTAAASAVAATGPGVWSPPLVVALAGAESPAAGTPLPSPGCSAGSADRDALLSPAGGALDEVVAVAAHRLALPPTPPQPLRGLPVQPPAVELELGRPALAAQRRPGPGRHVRVRADPFPGR
ncbi:hypothetical protein MRQ36_01705 [Micromonospora sp. R77]|uniref:hypothetical protein n=1 Tax=Micromonospora sp. R77 TaxID=2925836 RepID=UPI001F613DC1|nr:hypothetical protein [Micromonospora sp. R77]MCI4061355.1 hypothetical protein [Micromonospora sp. R77]